MPPSGEEGTDSMLLVRINVHACAPVAVSIDTMAKGSCFCPRKYINSRESCGAIAGWKWRGIQVENTVRTSTKSPHPNLYPWFIEELDSAGKRIGPDYKLWGHSLHFDVRNLVVCEAWGLPQMKKPPLCLLK